MSALFLLRHGPVIRDTPWRYTGTRDVPLSTAGYVRAALWAERLRNTGFTAVYTSDLSRCRETADIVCLDRSVPPVPAPALREIDLGVWDGLSKDEVRARFPGEYEARGSDMADFRPPDGESFRDVQVRALAFLSDLPLDQGNILAVTHAGVIRAILCAARHIDLNHLFSVTPGYGSLHILPFSALPILQSG
ncbi:MAG TPA: histidine phosphatase family protein [Desulfomicrobiaceae bacterium]|nr:histidine phosphatase family protein [Desulfomicrobiaceae bacterium]